MKHLPKLVTRNNCCGLYNLHYADCHVLHKEKLDKKTQKRLTSKATKLPIKQKRKNGRAKKEIT